MATTKNIIQRALPLDVKYNLIDKKYISLIDGGGCTCDNCGKLIANIATVKSESGKVFNIGFDCLETFLINNSLLDGKSVENFKHFRANLPAYIRRAKDMKGFILHNSKLNVTAIELHLKDFENWKEYGASTCLTYYFVFESSKKYNSYCKLKSDVNLNDFADVVKSICNVEIIFI